MTIAIDGTAVNSTGNTDVTITTCSLTTTQSNDLIFVAIMNNGFFSSSTVLSVAAPGVTGWTKRMKATDGTKQDSEVWYGVAASPLSAATITVTMNGGTEAVSVVAWGISGADTTTPFDNNSSLPNIAPVLSSSATYNSFYSTSNANDMLIGVAFNSTGTVMSSFPTGTTVVTTQNVNGEYYSSTVSAFYEVLSAAQNVVTLGVAQSDGALGGLTYLDAIRQASSPANPSTTPPSFDMQFGWWSQASSVSSTSTNFNNPQNSMYNNNAAVPSGQTTTDANNEAICVLVFYETGTTTPTSVSSVALPGSPTLTFSKQASYQDPTSGLGSIGMELWTAPVSGGPFVISNSSGEVTVNWNASVSNAGMVCFAVRGLYNASVPLDVGAFPAQASNSTSTTPPTITFSTSGANDLSVFLSVNNANDTPTTPSGWTKISYQPNKNNLEANAYMAAYTSVQSGATVKDASSSSTNSWTGMVVSFTANSTSISGSTTTTDTTDTMGLDGAGSGAVLMARYRYYPPAASNFTTKVGTNSVTPTATDTTDRGLQMNYGANATSTAGLRYIMKPLNAASNQTITMRLEMPDWGYNYTQNGVGFSNGTSFVFMYQLFGSNPSIGVQTWSNQTTNSSTLSSPGGVITGGIEWFQMKLVSGHPQTFSFSTNGQDWIEMYNTAITTISGTFTPTTVGFIMMEQHSSGTSVVSGTNEFYMNCLYYSDPDLVAPF